MSWYIGNVEIKNRVVLVTGGGGSIGSEICRQIITYNPKKLLMNLRLKQLKIK